jgi:hypothetical protein
MEKEGFVCKNCGLKVNVQGNIGTSNRNHCPNCCFSLHLDDSKGDRNSTCGGLMEPIGLSFKANEEISLVHFCEKCGKVSKNRIAADDNSKTLLEIFYNSFSLPEELQKKLTENQIALINKSEEEKMKHQLSDY